jgi:hypothetical protein
MQANKEVIAMGGRGGGWTFHPKQLDNLERLARKTLREGTEPARRNVFISFDSDDLALVNLLRGQAKNNNIPLEFNDFSLKEPFDSERAEYIKRGIRERIRQASVTIVFLTENSAKSHWVKWEIEESVKLGKGVIAVYQGDTPPRNVPSGLRTLGVKPVKWHADSIMAAIDEAIKKRH